MWRRESCGEGLPLDERHFLWRSPANSCQCRLRIREPMKKLVLVLTIALVGVAAWLQSWQDVVLSKLILRIAHIPKDLIGDFIGLIRDLSGILTGSNIMKTQYNFDVGSTKQVPIDNPLQNLFGRIDYQLNPTHRLVVREIYNHAENGSFSRNFRTFNSSSNVQNSGFRLGSNAFTSVDVNTSTVAQLFSNFANGKANEFLAGFRGIR